MITLWNATPAFDRVFDDVMRSAFGGYGTVTQFTPAVDVRSQEDFDSWLKTQQEATKTASAE